MGHYVVLLVGQGLETSSTLFPWPFPLLSLPLPVGQFTWPLGSNGVVLCPVLPASKSCCLRRGREHNMRANESSVRDPSAICRSLMITAWPLAQRKRERRKGRKKIEKKKKKEERSKKKKKEEKRGKRKKGSCPLAASHTRHHGHQSTSTASVPACVV